MTIELSPRRLAFIGGYGHHFLRTALSDAGVTVDQVAVSTDGVDDTAARRKFSALLEADEAQWFDEPIEMLDRFQPEVLSIGAVYAHNGPLVVEALRRDIRVVCDKPVAADWRTYERVGEAAQGRVLLTEFSFHSQATFRSARQAVRQGLVGKPVLVTAQKSYRFGDNRPGFYKRRADYGSTMLWVASHGVDAIRFVSGLEMTSVFGLHGNVSKPAYPEMEDHCAAMFTLSGEATGVVHADFLRPATAPTHGDDRLRLVGSLGVVEVRDGACSLMTHDQPERDITHEVEPAPMHRELLEAALSGGNELYNTADSLTVAAALLAARDAADQKQRVAIDP